MAVIVPISHLDQGGETAELPLARVDAFRAEASDGARVVFEVVDPLDGETRRHTFSLSGLSRALGALSCAKEQ